MRSLCVVVFSTLAAAPAQQPNPGGSNALVGTSSPEFSVADNHGIRARNGGYDAVGKGYAARLDEQGLRFEPALGATVVATQWLALRSPIVRRGAEPIVVQAGEPERSGNRIQYARGTGLREVYDVSADGIEVSWVFKEQPAGEGDLVVSYALDTSLPTPQRGDDGGLRFVATTGGATIGAVAGIDANGDRVDGRIDFRGGRLELSLPASFVADAAYPLVLDPPIAPAFGVAGGIPQQTEPDTCYDRSSNRYLVVWLQQFSVFDVRVFGQLVAQGGGMVGPLLQFQHFGGECRRPQIANYPALARFGVVWTEHGSISRVGFSCVDANAAQVLYPAAINFSGANGVEHADIACQNSPWIDSDRGFVVVYENNVNNRIDVRRFFFQDTTGPMTTTAPIPVFTDAVGVGHSYSEPAISRQTTSNGDYLVVANRDFGLNPVPSVVARTVSSDLSQIGPWSAFASGTAHDSELPAVDGYGDRWIVANTLAGPQGLQAGVELRLVESHGGALQIGTANPLAVSPTYSAPTVGYGRTVSFFGANSIHLNPAVVLFWGGSHNAVADPGGDVKPGVFDDHRIVAATMLSGGDVEGEQALVVWESGSDIRAQHYRGHQNAGSATLVSAACGGGGNQTFSHEPSIGSNGFACSVTGLAPTALLTVFNLSPLVPTSSCGACTWTPFAIPATPPIAAGAATMAFPIPYDHALVGSEFVTQWTTFAPLASPCVLLPGFVTSDTYRLVIQ